MSDLGAKILLAFAPKNSMEAFGVPDMALPLSPDDIKKLQSERQIEKETPAEEILRSYDNTFPNFRAMLENKSILDFGCGTGDSTFAFAEVASKSVGYDIAGHKFEKNAEKAKSKGLADKIAFTTNLSEEYKGSFDYVISMNSFEHFADPEKELDNMLSILKPDGKILLSFGPLWYSPFGVHNMFFIRIPWANILFSKQSIFKARQSFIDEVITDYSQLSLNEMSVKKFEEILSHRSIKMDYKNYNCSFNLNFFMNIPLLRELFINHITCIIKR
ncbi:MAG: class I SAM-dependent methyltransferase [Candidatus Thiodiazotropha sp.]